MSEDEDCMGGREFRRWRHERELLMDDAVYGLPKDKPPVVEPCMPNPPLTTPAKPGNYFAAAARKAGCEDEYDNAMEAKYGKGW